MRFSSAFVLGALAALAAAADNAFTMATLPSVIPADQPFSITWNPTTQDTVSLLLVNGPSSNVKPVLVIAGNITNSGSFTWTPPNSIPSGPNYALEIVDDANPTITNFSGQFSISSSTTASSSVSASSASVSASASESASSVSASKSASSKSTSGSTASAYSSSASSSAASSSGPASSAPSAAASTPIAGNNATSINTPTPTAPTFTTLLPSGTSSSSSTATSKAAAAEQAAPLGMGLLAFIGAAVMVL